jgi:cytochrome c oxidase cbb3-type subunit 3/ubiquinol-cytochrome c reductase cytochrome c subunit
VSLRTKTFVVAALAAALLTGCDNMPGKPGPGPEVPVPSSITDFHKLYAQNCSGCHGDNGQHGAAIALNSPEYLALVDDATLQKLTTQGIKGGLMPGFGASAGGLLTDAQIDAIVHGLRNTWGKGNVLAGLNPPPYAASGKGDVNHGGQVYASACARCHGTAGTQNQNGSILNGSYLALMDTQSLRTIVIVGRPEWGMPDWRNDINGHPLTDSDVTDVVAWMQAQAPAYAGQPYSSVQDNGHAPAPSNGKGEKF